MGSTATRVRGTGRIRKERFASGSLSWQVREFEKLQVEAAELVKSSIDAATKQMRLDALDDALRTAQHPSTWSATTTTER